MILLQTESRRVGGGGELPNHFNFRFNELQAFGEKRTLHYSMQHANVLGEEPAAHMLRERERRHG